MSEDAASSSSSARSHDHSGSPRWSSTQSTERSPRRSVLRTMEKSVVFRMRTEEKLSAGRGRQATSSSAQTMRLKQRETDDTDVHEALMELYAGAESKKQWLNSEEETFQRGEEQLISLQREHAELLDTLKKCKRRRKERARIQDMLRGPRSEGGSIDSDERSSSSGNSSDSDHSSVREHRRRSSTSRHHRSRNDVAKKERKKLRRFRSDVSLRFQLLQSERRRSDLQVEKAMTDLRREYADSCLFGNSLNF